jgi:hypothetical protein
MIAKLSLIRKGMFISFGATGMSCLMAASYLAGYALMIAGFVLAYR